MKYYHVKYQLWEYTYNKCIVEANNLRELYEYYSSDYYSFVSVRPATEHEIKEAKKNNDLVKII